MPRKTMPRRNNKKKLKSRRGRGGPISDINHNHTNITVDFWKIIRLRITLGSLALRLDTTISDLTEELGEIYKLYRFTSVKFIFQASPETLGQLALGINYIPANDAAPSPVVSDLEQFEGPAVGFYETERGAPYTYKVPSQVLNAMNYNWYETHSPDASDLTQGVFVFLSSIEDSFPINVLAHFRVEFQTLEDPAFLTRRLKPPQMMKTQTNFTTDETNESYVTVQELKQRMDHYEERELEKGGVDSHSCRRFQTKN